MSHGQRCLWLKKIYIFIKIDVWERGNLDGSILFVQKLR